MVTNNFTKISWQVPFMQNGIINSRTSLSLVISMAILVLISFYNIGKKSGLLKMIHTVKMKQSRILSNIKTLHLQVKSWSSQLVLETLKSLTTTKLRNMRSTTFMLSYSVSQTLYQTLGILIRA